MEGDAGGIPANDEAQVFTADEVAQRLKCGRSTLDRLISSGTFPGPDVQRGQKFKRWTFRALVAGIQQLAGEGATAGAK